MRLQLLALLMGIALAAFVPIMPSPVILYSLLLIAVVLLWLKSTRLLAFGLLGLGWALLFGSWQLDKTIEQQYQQQIFTVSGVVVDLPKYSTQGLAAATFTLRITEAPPELQPLRKIRLSWYEGEPVKAGQYWRFVVKLKAPHSLVNGSGFDYRLWALIQGIDAVGNVQSATLLAAAKPHSLLTLRERWRYLVNQSTVDDELKPLLIALAVGDRQSFTEQHKQVFMATGTSHLMVISGLHIGLFAIVGWWFGKWLAHLLHLPIARGWQLSFSGVAACLFALFYAAMAGFALPTQRALLMLLIAVLLKLRWRNYFFVDVLLVTAAVVLVLNPLSVMSASFWLSFIAVAMLGLVVSQWTQGQRWLTVISAQLWLFVGLLPVLAVAGLPMSVLAPVINIVAIPVVALLVVPPLLTTMLVALISGSAALLMLDYVSLPLQWLWQALQWAGSNSFTQPQLLSSHSVALIIACAGLLVILITRKTWLRWVGLACVLSVFLPWPVTSVERLRVTTLDVGQGLAVLVQTPNHVMLYDTGASYPSGFTLAEAVIAPQLHQQGINRIDKLVLSHSDNDHAGGAEYITARFDVASVLTPVPEQINVPSKPCQAGKSWQWDGVQFDVLHPSNNPPAKTNNQSCVLKIISADTTLLLTGDIERVVEHKLVNSRGSELKADVLLVPHHGSTSSSSPLFLEWVQPKLAINSSGYLNRFNHPAPIVTKRYQRYDIPFLNTALSGSVVIDLAVNNQPLLPVLARSQWPRYWRNYPCEIPSSKQSLSPWQWFIFQQNCSE